MFRTIIHTFILYGLYVLLQYLWHKIWHVRTVFRMGHAIFYAKHIRIPRLNPIVDFEFFEFFSRKRWHKRWHRLNLRLKIEQKTAT